MPPHPLTNFEIQKYYQNEPKFYGIYSRNNLPRINYLDGAYVINLDEFKSIGICWIVLYTNGNNIVCFNSFGLEHIPKGIKKTIGNKHITNIYGMQAYDLAMCGYFGIGFIDFMVKVKSLLHYTNLFSPNEYEENDKIILKYCQ